MSSAEARYLKINFDEVLRRLRDYARSKAKAYKVKAIVLTGSLAKGNYTGSSDADILVIADNLPDCVLERYALFSDPEAPIDLEPRVYTPGEFSAMIRQRDRFALESLEVGIPLYGERFLKDLMRCLKETYDSVKISEGSRRDKRLGGVVPS